MTSLVGASTPYQRFSDQLSWTHGKHTIRTGVEYGRIRWNWNFSGLGAGNVMFSTFDDFLLGLPGCTPGNTACTAANPGRTNGTAFSNIASTTQAAVLGPSGLPHQFRINEGSSFVNDDIKLTPRLTLNLGLRWEYGGLLNDIQGDGGNFWTSQILLVPVPGSTPATGSYAGYVRSRTTTRVLSRRVRAAGSTRRQEHGYWSSKNKTSLRAFRVSLWQPLGGNKFVVYAADTAGTSTGLPDQAWEII